MSITAVPIKPVKRRVLVYLWLGIVLAVIGAAALAWQSPTDPVSGFLAKNRRAAGVVETPSGLQYKVLTIGRGAAPTTSDVALVEYDGKLTNGERFDKSQQPTPFPLGENAVVPGFEEAMTLVPKGGEIRAWIKPELAYKGEEKKDQTGKVVIPANSVLVFDIKMVDFLSKTVIQQMQMQQQMMQQQGVPGGVPPQGVPGGVPPQGAPGQ